ncbi:hypothetical protein Ddye_029441, partial [Dipteronia dyeriana]
TGKKNKNNITENEGSGKSKAVWNDDLVAIYCEICVKEVAKGNRPGTHFDKIGWVNVVKVFKEITRRDYDKKKQLKNKWDSLKIDWKLWSSLLHKKTGIGWDPAKKTVDAPPEWWQSKIEMNVEYRKFRDVGISPDMMDMYDKMFKGSVEVGNCVMIPSSTILLEEKVVDSDHDKQTVNRENEEALQGDQDGGKKRTNDESEKTGGVVGGSNGKKGKFGGVEKGSQLWWFATDLFCSQDKREMFSVMVLKYSIDNSGDEEGMDQLICVTGRLIQVYLEQYVLKNPCMTSSQTGFIWLMEVLQGNESRCYNMFRMDRHVFIILLNELETIYKLKGSRNISTVEILGMFLYILGQGWEGSAHDTRVFLSVLRDPQSNFPKPLNGKYYLVDAGYPQMKGFLGPYKGERYHLPHFHRGEQTSSHKEIFNHAHSSLRSIIERTFGVWKKKWSILRDMPSYSYEKQVKIVIATMTLHNYIRRNAQRDRDFDESENYLSKEVNEEMEVNAHEENSPRRREMEMLRNVIAQSLMSACT